MTSHTKIDTAVFQRIGATQTYAGALYKNGSLAGNLPDIMGAFIPGVTKKLKTNYPGIVIEMR